MDKESKLRPYYLVKILYERTDEDHYLTTAQLMGILEKEYGIKIHLQTVPSDVETAPSLWHGESGNHVCSEALQPD